MTEVEARLTSILGFSFGPRIGIVGVRAGCR